MCHHNDFIRKFKVQFSAHQTRLNELAKQLKGLSGGALNGIRGYFLTFVIAYLRDFGLRHQFTAERFETSVPWDRETKRQVIADCKRAGVQLEPMTRARVTQTYDSGACIYFNFGVVLEENRRSGLSIF